jgi:polysaccharide pyruvyl transferase WcaK-like protein
MLIEVKGVQFVNKGAELMLHAVLQQIQQRWPQAQLVLAPNPNSPYVARAALGALQRLPLRKGPIDLSAIGRLVPVQLRRWLKNNLGIVFACDIDVVLDASGFAYGDPWPEANSKLLCAEIERFSAAGKAYILLPQAMGPFSRPGEQQRLRRALPKASLICAREHSSFTHLQQLIGSVAALREFGDFTNLVSAAPVVDYQHGDTKVLIIPNANMLSGRNQHVAWRSHYLAVLQNAISVVHELGLTPVLLNHEGSDDAAICHTLQQQAAAGAPELITETDPLRVKGIIAASKAVICSRFHGCVSALAQGVPCLGTSWSHKYERLFEQYDQADALLDAHCDKAGLRAKLTQVIANADSALLAERRAILKQQSEQMWQAVAGVITDRLPR